MDTCMLTTCPGMAEKGRTIWESKNPVPYHYYSSVWTSLFNVLSHDTHILRSAGMAIRNIYPTVNAIWGGAI